MELELRGAPAGSSTTWLPGDCWARAVEEVEEELGMFSESGWTWTSSDDWEDCSAPAPARPTLSF